MPDEQEHEQKAQEMNNLMREQLARRRERAPLLWPAEPRDNDDDQQEDEEDARD